MRYTLLGCLLGMTSCVSTEPPSNQFSLTSDLLQSAPCPDPEPKPLGPPVRVSNAQLQDTKHDLPEISGIARSLTYPGVYYVHNDSGSLPEVFGVTLEGKIEAKISVDAGARDWEDISTAPCGLVHCIYVADIGNNGMGRDDLGIYEFKEPELKSESKAKAVKYSFKYPSINHDAEAFAYNPTDGHFYIISKRGGTFLYRLPKPLVDRMVPEKLCELDISDSDNKFVTAMDFSDDGRMLVRTYSNVIEYPGAGCTKASAFKGLGLNERQGEAISYLEGKEGFVTVSEGIKPDLNVYERK